MRTDFELMDFFMEAARHIREKCKLCPRPAADEAGPLIAEMDAVLAELSGGLSEAERSRLKCLISECVRAAFN
jgi:hypothetical protein